MKLIIKIFFIILTLIITGINTEIYAFDIGKVIQIRGKIERSSITTGSRFKTKIGTSIKYAQKLKVGKESMIEVLLENGTSILIKENSIIYFYNIRLKKSDPPTKIKLDYGKIKITPKKTFNDRTLVLTTPTAIISIVNAKLSVIASRYETKLISYSSKVGVANINPGIRKAYVILEGEEVSVRRNVPPTHPRQVPNTILKFWFDYYNITDDKKFIIRNEREEGIIDWILRKREF